MGEGRAMGVKYGRLPGKTGVLTGMLRRADTDRLKNARSALIQILEIGSGHPQFVLFTYFSESGKYVINQTTV